MLRRALRMDSRHGAAAIHGLVDGTQGLDDAEALELLELAADWPAPGVRLAALKRLADRGPHSDALARPRTGPGPPLGRDQPGDPAARPRRR